MTLLVEALALIGIAVIAVIFGSVFFGARLAVINKHFMGTQ